MSRSRSFTSAVEDYLKAIYRLERLADRPVSTTALASSLGLRAASVSGMLKKLDDLELIEYRSYHGVSLTEAGRRSALSVMRRHRLVELFLAEVLGIGWDEVHAEAEALEHAISPGLCDRIAARLGDPTVDPHGDPIPTKDGECVEPPTLGLGDIEPGAHATLVRVSDRDSSVLKELTALRIALGAEMTMIDRSADGSSRVAVGSRHCTLRPDVVAAMRVVA